MSKKKKNNGVHPALVLLLFILGGWELSVKVLEIPEYLFVAPSRLVMVLIKNHPVYLRHLQITLEEAGVGFTVGTLLALAGAVILVHFPRFKQGVLPWAIAAQTTPVVVYATYLLILFGSGVIAKMIIAGILSFFATLIVATRGLSEIDQALLDAMSLETSSRLTILWKLRFPLSAPYIVSALKVAATSAILGAVVGEWVSGGGQGIGHLLLIYKAQLRTPELLGAATVVIAASTSSYGIITLLERLVVRWDYR